MIRRIATLIGLAAAAIPGMMGSAHGSAMGLPAPVACASCWQPPMKVNFQWQLSGKLDSSVKAHFYDVDMFGTTKAQVAKLHSLGRKVTCYIDAGSWENYRPDANSYPKSVLGNKLDGWPNERWLDIRQTSILMPIIQKRVDQCVAKGFDAVEYDNVDGYQNNTGFPLTAQDQLNFNALLANMAHSANLSVALKNDPDQAKALVRYFDWELDEQCAQYQECGKLLPFIQAKKPVFEVEYNLPTSKFCAKAKKLGFNAMRKHLNLGPWRHLCP